jgi:hypothetical protein
VPATPNLTNNAIDMDYLELPVAERNLTSAATRVIGAPRGRPVTRSLAHTNRPDVGMNRIGVEKDSTRRLIPYRATLFELRSSIMCVSRLYHSRTVTPELIPISHHQGVREESATGSGWVCGL